VSTKAGKQIRKNLERDIRDAIVDREYWLGKLEGVTHPIARQTYQRGVDDAEARLREARNKLGR
jgi:hypothetical protein